MTSLATALPDEIMRVIGVRDDFISLRGMPNVMVEPQIKLMTRAIEEAVRAMGEGDVIAMLRCHESLMGWGS